MRYEKSLISDQDTLVGDNETAPLLLSTRTVHQTGSSRIWRSRLYLWVSTVIVCLGLACFVAYLMSDSKSAKAEVVIPCSVAIIGIELSV